MRDSVSNYAKTTRTITKSPCFRLFCVALLYMEEKMLESNVSIR